MSRAYRDPQDVPTEAIVERLKDLVSVITDTPSRIPSEFDMRIPAEADRDADIVMSEAARRLAEFSNYIARLEAALWGVMYDIEGLISESEGVAGLHRNGDLAPWHELTPDGQFERLGSLTEARALLSERAGT